MTSGNPSRRHVSAEPAPGASRRAGTISLMPAQEDKDKFDANSGEEAAKVSKVQYPVPAKGKS